MADDGEKLGSLVYCNRLRQSEEAKTMFDNDWKRHPLSIDNMINLTYFPLPVPTKQLQMIDHTT